MFNKMTWKTTYHTKSTDEETEHIRCQLYLNFEETRWNKSKQRYVVELYFTDFKKPKTWDINPLQTYTQIPHKRCEITFNYFQNHSQTTLYSGVENYPIYEDFDIEYCKQKAIEIFNNRLKNVILQLETPTREVLFEKVPKFVHINKN